MALSDYYLGVAPVDSTSMYAAPPYFGIDTGTVNSYIITPSPAVPYYYIGLSIRVKISTTNTNSSNINVNKLGSIPIILQNGNNIGSGVLISGGIYELVYDGSHFQLQTNMPTTIGSGYQFFSSSTTFTIPTGVYSIRVLVMGSGGGGGNGAGAGGNGGNGGGAGFFLTATIATTPGQVYTITIGAGGPTYTHGNISSISNSSLGLILAGGGSEGYQYQSGGGYGGAMGGREQYGGSYQSPTGLSIFTHQNITTGAGGNGGGIGGGWNGGAYAGGGGGGGLVFSISGSVSAGAGYGGAGGGTGYGAGGGGGQGSDDAGSGGAGAPGCAYIEWG